MYVDEVKNTDELYKVFDAEISAYPTFGYGSIVTTFFIDNDYGFVTQNTTDSENIVYNTLGGDECQ